MHQIEREFKSNGKGAVNADADGSYKVAKEITSKIREEAMGQNVMISVSPGQLLTKIVADELTELMGGESADINLEGNPNIILLHIL